ncbi:hypothetical protein FRACYDRAFT_247387 [Fragilariopsis cylindrus CCMP1102]|uniref:Uncharacterized protein n=1 Tax=Fragilariopsis cylindrus CCMP1102 TaxID=635003 RepID=A0A1E7EX14_9STRA|nr:hypothetical protein FRACYDRAFT_247387 [Fragilariopsis cylindrus CCMP1102]|eukprot:OEU10354.1 hypothetical protein FRACYDRAFT_247387 [Fragilariopsis cylindrus CCMP1102]
MINQKRSRDLDDVGEHEPAKKRVKIHNKKTTIICDGVDPCIVTRMNLVFPLTDIVAAFIAEMRKRSNDDDGVVKPPSPLAQRSSSALPFVVSTTTTSSDNEKHKPTRNYNTSLPTVEGGIVDAKQFRVTKYEHAYELEDRDKDNSIAVVGLGLELLTLEASISM